jgi:hypothetical protein
VLLRKRKLGCSICPFNLFSFVFSVILSCHYLPLAYPNVGVLRVAQIIALAYAFFVDCGPRGDVGLTRYLLIRLLELL